MSYLLIAAGVLSLLFVAAHIFGGGPDVHVPLLDSAPSEELGGYVSIIWHGVTASMLVCAVLFLIAAKSPKLRAPLAFVAVTQFLLFAALFLFYGTVRLGSIWVMPQWTGFVLIALVALFGIWRNQPDGLQQ